MTNHMSIRAGRIIRISTTQKPENVEEIKAAGWSFNGFDEWQKEATSNDNMIELVKEAVSLGGAINLKAPEMLDQTEQIFGDIPVIVYGTYYKSITECRGMGL